MASEHNRNSAANKAEEDNKGRKQSLVESQKHFIDVIIVAFGTIILVVVVVLLPEHDTNSFS